jgi:hypothetical protein
LSSPVFVVVVLHCFSPARPRVLVVLLLWLVPLPLLAPFFSRVLPDPVLALILTER